MIHVGNINNSLEPNSHSITEIPENGFWSYQVLGNTFQMVKADLLLCEIALLQVASDPITQSESNEALSIALFGVMHNEFLHIAEASAVLHPCEMFVF